MGSASSCTDWLPRRSRPGIVVYNRAAISMKAATRMERTTMAATVMGVWFSSMKGFMAISF